MAGHDTLNSLYGDRFILGLGVSHIPLVEGRRGHAYGKPVATMRAYLDSMAAAELAISAPARNVVLAALGPNMLALARDRAAGALPYNVTPEHTAEAKKILGPDAWLCVEQKICLTSDPAAARDVAAANMARYMAMPNYRNNWLQAGIFRGGAVGTRQRPVPRRDGRLGQRKGHSIPDRCAFCRRRDTCLHPAARPVGRGHAGLERPGGVRARRIVIPAARWGRRPRR